MPPKSTALVETCISDIRNSSSLIQSISNFVKLRARELYAVKHLSACTRLTSSGVTNVVRLELAPAIASDTGHSSRALRVRQESVQEHLLFQYTALSKQLHMVHMVAAAETQAHARALVMRSCNAVKKGMSAHMPVLQGQQCSSAELQQLGTLLQCCEPAPATTPSCSSLLCNLQTL